ncbi:IS30 family transposase [Mycobacterium marinum]|uniref:IS30 family transposase n=1 Tax=Mycobacterium marinum TaxID=1781 RepID=UPI003FEEF7E0
MRLCHESIYQAVHQPNSRFLRPSRLEPHRRSPLRTGRDHRRAHHRQQRRRGRFQQPMLTIHDRLFPPVDRSEAGHREGDLIIGDNHHSAIGTLVERQTRMLRLLHLPRADSDSLHGALVARIQDLPTALMRSITWDQGTEMARHLAPRRSAERRCTSAIPDHPGNGVATRTPTDCCATTSRRA